MSVAAKAAWAHRDHDLIEPAHHPASSVEARNRRAAVLVDDQRSRAVMLGAQAES